MSQIHPEQDHLRVLIETLQRAGVPEEAIHRAVRRAAGGDDRPGRSHRVLRLLPVRRQRQTT